MLKKSRSNQNKGTTKVIAALLVMAISAGIAGCSSGSGATPGSTPTPAPTPNPAPAVTAVSPNSAPAGALAFTLTVHGSNFVPASTGEWNGVSRTTTVVSSTLLQAHITAADLAAPGTVTVTVFNPAPGGGSSNGSTFTVAVNTIAFVSRRLLDGSDAVMVNLNQNIWVMNPDGSNQTPLTKLTTKTSNGFILESLNPVWSPDGSKIALVSARALDGSDAINMPNGTRNIWVMNADGSSTAPLTKLTGELTDCLNPAWSPDGSKIVFHTRRALNGTDFIGSNSTDNVWLMNADGSSQTALTKLTANISSGSSPNPIWSPDGSKTVFVSGADLSGIDFPNNDSTTNIWVMSADGSGITPLTKITAASADSGTPTRP